MDAAPRDRAPRAWLPEALAASAVVALAVAARLRPLRNGDLLWQIAAGEAITARRALLHHETFSATVRGAPVHDHEPAFEVLVSAVHRLGGLTAVWWAGLFATAAAFAVAFVLARRVTPSPLARLAAVALVLIAAAPRLEPRAEWAAFAAVALAHALRRSEEAPATSGEGRARSLRTFAPLAVALIGGPFHGLVVLVALVPLAHAVEAALRRDVRSMTVDLGVAAAVPIAVHVSSPHALGAVFAHLRAPTFSAHIVEYYSPLRTVVRSGDPSPLLAIGVAAIAAVGLHARAREGRARPADAVLVAMLLVPGVIRARFVVLAGLAALPWVVGGLAAFFEGVAQRVSAGLRAPIAALLCASAATVLTAELGLRPVIGFDWSDQPVRAVDWLREHRPAAKLFHPFNYGSYLIYRRYPAAGVVIDPRAAAAYPEAFARAYYQALEEPAQLSAWLDRDGYDAVLLSRWHRGTARAREALARDERWRVAWEDTISIVYVR